MSRIVIYPTPTPMNYRLDDRFRGFGNYFVIILNQKLFFDRLRAAAKRQNINIFGRFVEYLNLSRHTGEKTLFQKDVAYSWQNEYRFLINTGGNQPFLFSIGSIKDISRIFDIRETSSFIIKL